MMPSQETKPLGLSLTLEYDPWPSSLTMLVVLRDQAGFLGVRGDCTVQCSTVQYSTHLGVRGDWARDWAS